MTMMHSSDFYSYRGNVAVIYNNERYRDRGSRSALKKVIYVYKDISMKRIQGKGNHWGYFNNTQELYPIKDNRFGKHKIMYISNKQLLDPKNAHKDFVYADVLPLVMDNKKGTWYTVPGCSAGYVSCKLNEGRRAYDNGREQTEPMSKEMGSIF